LHNKHLHPHHSVRVGVDEDRTILIEIDSVIKAEAAIDCSQALVTTYFDIISRIFLLRCSVLRQNSMFFDAEI
jgi:hypothetical protein